jgi:D-glycero-D-manno-heptose 1,7-bisphosphate phosphatase
MSLVIFDMDGTLVFNATGSFSRLPEEQTLLPGVEERCEALRAEGHTLAVASNQGGVAMGYLTYEASEALVANAARLIGADFYEFCPFHAGGLIPRWVRPNPPCRKPNPGMLVQLMQRTNTSPDDCLFVGDSPEDWGAALAAGVEFQWATVFFQP